MQRYVLRRLLALIPVLLGVTLLVFLMLHIVPGDPVLLMVQGFERIETIPPDLLARLRQQFGLDKPILVQYVNFLWGAIRGDFGVSISRGRRVKDVILQDLPFTVELAVGALVFALVVGLTGGIVSAVKRGTWLDTLTMIATTWGVAMPNFWFGLIAIIIFAQVLGWFPTSGQGSVMHLVLPSVTLGTYSAALIARLSRSGLIETLSEDYIRTARAKGLGQRVVVLRHALRNSLIPVITVVGLEFGALLGGAVVTETVFARRGIGFLMVTAILGKDFPLAQALVLFSALVYVTANLIVDLLYALADPRIKYA